jgi:3-hydroxyacyl-CoA dehydrogenase
MHPRRQAGHPGNLEDDLGKLADCDWIIEAVLERSEVKQALYAKARAVRKPRHRDRLSNTSTIPLPILTEGLPEAFARFPDHPFLQPAALHAPAGAGRRPRDAIPTRSPRSPISR